MQNVLYILIFLLFSCVSTNEKIEKIQKAQHAKSDNLKQELTDGQQVEKMLSEISDKETYELGTYIVDGCDSRLHRNHSLKQSLIQENSSGQGLDGTYEASLLTDVFNTYCDEVLSDMEFYTTNSYKEFIEEIKIHDTKELKEMLKKARVVGLTALLTNIDENLRQIKYVTAKELLEYDTKHKQKK